MKLTKLETIKSEGFLGFKTVKQLWQSHEEIPNEKGVYLVINPSPQICTFLEVGVGGYFKNKNPNVLIEELNKNWVNDSHIVYIGRAGGGSSSATLRRRLKQYLDFGKGKPNVGHYGGRFIWQLENHAELIFAWKPLKSEDPSIIETALLNEFRAHFKKLPFANLRM
jgi:hypothetical protein